MIAQGLLGKIGYTEKMQNIYAEYRSIADERIFEYAKNYMDDKITIHQAKDLLDSLGSYNMHIFTIYLIFVLECSGWLEEKYKNDGRTEKMFLDAMRDIYSKTVTCMRKYGVFGIEPICWFDGFFSMKRFATTRLQFNKAVHSENKIELSNYTVEDGDLIFHCHIPSDGPLTYEKRIASYKELYDFYKEELKDGILVIHCTAWFFYPEYLKRVYKETSNILDFSRDFEMYDRCDTEEFRNCWRVFYRDFEGDTSVLPQETSLQKSFVKYLEETPKLHGTGSGILLFDGKKILTRK